MNIQSVFSELESASDFELFRLQQAILKVLDDPDRVQRLKQKIQVGMTVDYFCAERNTLITCQVTKLGRSRVDVVELESQKRWSLPFHWLNLDHIEADIVTSKPNGLSKAELAVGQTVGFVDPRDNQEHIGQVVKLNPKRVVLAIDNKQWSVPYSLLFPVLVSQAQESKQTLLLK
ncbi:hypothetical protein [Vibrio paucivorans]|uniref:Uncharacterized protein n=1 Tax=Vibrio paucivorans TaxID=2829489 RepID=A0A9X3CIU8_9VIBR|nr:hypothetical protein [Vibrio paucivorans]MCW8336634.1 hypothetical protein [Vibrio paucivorans]